jgi:hypothetical protein
MKIKHILFAVIASLLLTAGFAKAAQSFDVVTTSSQVVLADDNPSGASCVIIVQ